MRTFWACGGVRTHPVHPPPGYGPDSTPGSAVPFVPFHSPLSSSLCAFLSEQGAQHTLTRAFWGQFTYLNTF